MKVDLKDVTFSIPIRIDSQDRMENLELVIDYLTHHFDTNIIVKEVSETSVLMNCPFIKKVKYNWEFSDNETFHRTKILNDMLEETKTPYWVNYDCDVLFPVQSYVDTVNALRHGEVFVFPYLGPFHEVPRRFIPSIKEKMEVKEIDLNQCGINHPSSVGGAMFMNTEVYKKLGGESEAFLDWGGEDNFRVLLFERFGYKVERRGTVLYHMEHWRGPSSSGSNPHFNKNMNMFYQAIRMNEIQLKNFVNGYNRFK